MRLLKMALIRLADLVDDRLFNHRYIDKGFCIKVADHPWWDL